jgi:hypothetical protein
MESRTVGKTAIPPPMFIKAVSSSSVKKNTMLGRFALATAIDRPTTQRANLGAMLSQACNEDSQTRIKVYSNGLELNYGTVQVSYCAPVGGAGI